MFESFIESAKKLYDPENERFSSIFILRYPVRVSFFERTFISRLLPSEKLRALEFPAEGPPYIPCSKIE